MQFCWLEKVIDRARGIKEDQVKQVSSFVTTSWQPSYCYLPEFVSHPTRLWVSFIADFRKSLAWQIYMHFWVWSLHASEFLGVRITNIRFALTANHDNLICISYSFYIVSHLPVSHLYLEWRRLKLVRSVENIFFLWQSENMHWSVKEPHLLNIGLDFHRYLFVF